MMGIISNILAIMIGCIIGSVLAKRIKKKYSITLFNTLGLSVMMLGVATTVMNMQHSHYPVLFLFSLVIGSLLGEALKLEDRICAISAKYAASKVGQGVVTAILMYCVGTFAILGPIESAIAGDNTFLYMNAALIFCTSIALSASYGFYILLSAIVVFIWQTGLYFLGLCCGKVITSDLLAEISIVGGILISVSGMEMLKFPYFKTTNMLPALLVSVVLYCCLASFIK